MRRSVGFAAASISTLVLTLAMGGGVVLASHTLVVDDDLRCPGAAFSTIQSAVDAADPGSTVLVCAGTYEENVVVRTDGLRLSARGRVVVVGLDPASAHGILLQDVSDVVVEGFTVVNGLDNIRLNNSDGNTIRRNTVVGPSGHDGILLNNSDGNLIEYNRSIANGTPMNGCGIDILAGSSDNVIRYNFVKDNDRAGIRVQNAGPGNVVAHNLANNNGRNGILNQASNGTLIEDNHAQHNAGESISGDPGVGIRVVSSTDVAVVVNNAHNNSDVDLRWDESGTVTFSDNRCLTSSPDGLCEL